MPNVSIVSSLANKTSGVPNVKCSKQVVVSAQLKALSEYVRAVMNERELNYRQVAERSGGLISHTTVFDVVNLRSKDVKAKTLRGLAKGLGVSEDEMFSVARGKSPADNPEFKKWKFASLFDEAEQLTPEQMARFEIIMEMARREVQRMIQEQDQQEQQEAPRRAKRVPDLTTVINAAQGEKKKRA